jgi:hypothetical protein|nr:MAG TPA: hypothetical protein [Caudoviricetes sp.]
MGVIKGGKYYPDEQPVKQQVKPVVSQIATRGNIDRDYEDHAHDLIQPYMADGTPNPDFIEYYPEDAKNYGFIPDKEED